MRPRYSVESVVLGRSPHGEASATIALLTAEFGLVRARAQGVRKPGAKLAPALQTFAECEAILVRGKDVWRLSGAVLVRSFATALPKASRERAGRVASLALRLMRGESSDAAPFHAFRGLLASLPSLTEDEQDAAECLAALRLLSALGLDTGELPGEDHDYGRESLAPLLKDRKAYVARVNRGITASGL